MCDSMVALGNSTKDGSVIFAKNCDRQPNEPHIVIRVPRKKYNESERLKCTYIEIEQSRETYEVLLLKPSWIWGCEMGSNEYGLTIGNEAVFTKEKGQHEERLIGMDMIRIALERCKTAEEAMNMMIELLERYGQGGNCGYENKFFYHNSFLIADRSSAWVLETAGEYWAAEEVKDIRTISNCLTIERNFDRYHPELINNAINKGWCKDKSDFNFAKCYSNSLITHLSQAKERHGMTASMLQKEKGNITVSTMQGILRYHNEEIEGKQFTKHSLNSICMHGGFIYGDHTTGSYVASLNDIRDTHWITGSSTPCISLFKPLWLIDKEGFTFDEENKENAVDFWLLREKLHRMFIENKIPSIDEYISKRDELENKIVEMVEETDLNNVDKNQLVSIMDYAIKKEEELINNTIKSNENNPVKINGNIYFKHYWRNQNKKLENN